MDAADLCFTSALDLGRMIRAREISPVEIATAVLESATEYLRPFGEYRMIAYGTILLFGMMFFPKGILTLGPSIKHWVTRLYSADARS